MKGDIEMHPMRFSNKQIQDMLADMRKQLKTFKTTANAISTTFKFPALDKPKAKVIINLEAWLKIQALVAECDKEVAWHGLVTKNKNVYTIEDIVVFPQTVTGCTVTSDETAYSLWLAQQPDEIFKKIRFHGHSHVNMGVSPSNVDTSYQEDILINLNDFYIFGIFNKKDDNWMTIFDVEDNVVYEDTDIELVTPDVYTIQWAKEAIKEFVKETTPKSYKKDTKKKTAQELREEEEYVYGNYGYDGYDYYGGLERYYGQK